MLAKFISSRSQFPKRAANIVRHYHENIIDHYENPRNVGSLDKKKTTVGTGLVGAPACGDVMKLQFEVDDTGRIIDAKFKTFGCGSAIASSSVATEWLKGKTVDECLTIKVSPFAVRITLIHLETHHHMLITILYFAEYRHRRPPEATTREAPLLHAC